jgi:hypothetical protein
MKLQIFIRLAWRVDTDMVLEGCNINKGSLRFEGGQLGADGFQCIRNFVLRQMSNFLQDGFSLRRSRYELVIHVGEFGPLCHTQVLCQSLSKA